MVLSLNSVSIFPLAFLAQNLPVCLNISRASALSLGFSPVFKSVFKINSIGSTDSFQIQVLLIAAISHLPRLPDWKRVCHSSVVQALPSAPCQVQKTMLTAPSDLCAQKSTVPLFRRSCGPTRCYLIAPGKHTGPLVVSDPSHPWGFSLCQFCIFYDF